MNDYIFLMHDDAPSTNESEHGWDAYFSTLRASGQFSGGSAISDGICMKKAVAPPQVTTQVVGYIRVQAASLDEAKKLVSGNPVYEAGGTVEIRELPRTD